MKGVLLGALFALAWTGLTGLGVFNTLRTFARSLDARRRYVPVDATIVQSRLVGKSNRRLEVTFSYSVGGVTRTATGPYVEHLSAGFETTDASAYPAGGRIQAWMDPERPDRAVLDRSVPPSAWFFLLFLQPFATIGIAGLLAVARAPFDFRRERAFLRGVSGPDIPGWGTLTDADGTLVLHQPAAALGAAATAWGLSTTAAALTVGMAAAGFGFNPRAAVLAALVACALVAVAMFVRTKRRGGRTLSVDRPRRRVIVAGVEIPWAKIRGLAAIQWMSKSRRGTVDRGVRLVLVDDDRREHVLNEFQGRAEDVAVADRIGRHLADLMKTTFEART